jgi:hypothetical protein
MRFENSRTVLRLLAWGCGIIATASCASGPRGKYLAGDISDDIRGIETGLSVEPSTVLQAEGARIRLSITNVSEQDVQIRFPETRQVVLLVLDAMGNLEVTDDHTVAIPPYLFLGTLESWEHTMEWDGRIEIDGRRVDLSPGRYQLQVGLRRSGALYVNRTNPVSIEVVAAAR